MLPKTGTIMKKFIAVMISFFVLNTSIYAACNGQYASEIEKQVQKIEKTKKIAKYTGIGTGAGVGVPVGVFMGIMFKIVADGATVLISVGQGFLFGGVAGGLVASAVLLPFFTYLGIAKGRSVSLTKSYELILEAEQFKFDGPRINKVFKRIRKKHKHLTIEALAERIRFENENDTFCNGVVSTHKAIFKTKKKKARLPSFSKIRRYLRNTIE
jgi:hypothetical protein